MSLNVLGCSCMFLNWQVLLVSVGSSRFFKLKALECSGRFVKVLEGSCRFCRFLNPKTFQGFSIEFLEVLLSFFRFFLLFFLYSRASAGSTGLTCFYNFYRLYRFDMFHEPTCY